MLNFSVRSDRCGGCGLCVQDCPTRIIKLSDNNRLPFIAPGDERHCLECQHCLAVCPNGAISILGMDPDNSMLLNGSLPDLESMSRLVRGRRSVRQYRDANVDPQLIKKLLATVANAPTGRNNRQLTFTIIDDKDTLEWFRTQTMQSLDAIAKSGRLPEHLSFLKNAISNYFADQGDGVFRGAPHVLIVSAEPDAPCALEDVTIALSYFELLAQSAGLGTVWCGILKWVLELVPELKTLIGLPHRHPYYTMLFGYPAITYARTVQRDEAATVARVSIVNRPSGDKRT